MAENKNIEVGGRLHSIATGNVLAGADEILDDTIGKKQSEINVETYRLVENINESLENLSPEQTEALSVATKANNNEVKLGYFECLTDGNVASKTITDATGYVLSKGGSIKIKMINANTASNVTLNINSTGAKTLYYNGELASPTNTWENNEIIEVYYDGNNYYANNIAGAGKFTTGEKVKEVGIDDEPTAGSNNLVKSGGVQNELALGAVYDVSSKNPTSGPNSDGKWESLSTLLSDASLNTLIPTSVRKGGMNIKFIQSSDNKYVQYRLMADKWSVDTDDWAIADEGVLVENSEFICVKTDAEGKILWAIKTDGSIYYGAGVPQQVINYINEKIAELSLDEYEDIVAFLTDYLGSDTTLKEMIDSINASIAVKLDKEGLDSEALGSLQETYDELLQVTIDSEDKILSGRSEDGKLIEYAGINTNNLQAEQIDSVSTTTNSLIAKQITFLTEQDKDDFVDYLDVQTKQGISELVIDLPVSDGTDIQSGYAYIGSTDRCVKVKA